MAKKGMAAETLLISRIASACGFHLSPGVWGAREGGADRVTP